MTRKLSSIAATICVAGFWTFVAFVAVTPLNSGAPGYRDLPRAPADLQSLLGAPGSEQRGSETKRA